MNLAAQDLTIYRTRSFWSRLGGLLTRPALGKGEALYLAPCASVHTFFMNYDIDIVFIDRAGCVLKAVEALRPWRTAWCRGAHAVLELRAGQAACHGMSPGASLRPLLGEKGFRQAFDHERAAP